MFCKGYSSGRLSTDSVCIYIIAILLFSFSEIPAQSEYLMSLSNAQKTNDNTFEFDVLIKGVGADFELTSYQAALNFDIPASGSTSVSFSYIDNSSELVNIPSISIGVNLFEGKSKLTFASMPGSDIITEEEVKVGRFRLETSLPFNDDPFITWSFEGTVTTIITGASFTNITDPSFHVSGINNLTKFSVTEVTASATTDLNTAPEKTIDGLGYYDNDPNSRWAADPLPQWISYDLGYEKLISRVKISFFKFQLNRIYQYSISVSSDNSQWTEVASDISSLPEEWSITDFSPVTARYVKIDIYSSTNNPESWASIWETEIFGSNQTTENREEEISLSDFELMQNYPNPFNPTTNIAFNLLEDADTKLTVYNIMGEKVTDLVDDYLSAGRHEIAFNGEGLASGVYVYKLNVKDEFSQIKKMILIK